MNEMLVESIEDIFNDINSYMFAQENVDLNHVYIDGTKFELMPTNIPGCGRKPAEQAVKEHICILHS